MLKSLTIHKGLAGATQGAPLCQIDVGNAVPAVGFEYNPGTDGKTGNFVVLTLALDDGSTYTSEGYLTGDDLSFAVNSESKLNFRFEGELSDWQ